jgi:hypothetical protein
MYRTLNPDRIVETITQLEHRIVERFPGCGLLRVCGELLQVARESRARVVAAGRPNCVLRATCVSLTLAGLALLCYVGSIIEVKRDADNVFGVLQGIDSAFTIAPLSAAVQGTPGAPRPEIGSAAISSMPRSRSLSKPSSWTMRSRAKRLAVSTLMVRTPLRRDWHPEKQLPLAAHVMSPVGESASTSRFRMPWQLPICLPRRQLGQAESADRRRRPAHHMVEAGPLVHRRWHRETEATGLIEEGRPHHRGAVSPAGGREFRAPLNIAADGRHSALREKAGLEVQNLGAPIDVLWFRLSRPPGDTAETMGRFEPGAIIVSINRGDYWQCAFVRKQGAISGSRWHCAE